MNENPQKKAPFLSLRWILLAGYAVAGIVPLLLLSSTMLHSVQGYFVEERKKELLSEANVISGQLTSSGFLFNKEARSDMEEIILETSQNGDPSCSRRCADVRAEAQGGDCGWPRSPRCPPAALPGPREL